MKTKTKFLIYPLLFIGALLVVSGCKKTGNNNPDPSAVTVTDIDGNVYKTIILGSQLWMAENLKTTKYNDGTPISLVSDSLTWSILASPAYCWYKNDSNSYKKTYGALYNWYVVNTGKLAPEGWHIPTDIEWSILSDYLGGESVAGGKMKETGFVHWLLPNKDANNSSGFTALPSGEREGFYGTFEHLGWNCAWWSVTESYSGNAFYRALSHTNGKLYRSSFNGKSYGYSVRCIKD